MSRNDLSRRGFLGRMAALAAGAALSSPAEAGAEISETGAVLEPYIVDTPAAVWHGVSSDIVDCIGGDPVIYIGRQISREYGRRVDEAISDEP